MSRNYNPKEDYILSEAPYNIRIPELASWWERARTWVKLLFAKKHLG